MASLHRDPRGRSPYWYAAFTNSNGRRAFRSTKQTDKGKATRVALKFEDAAKKGLEGTLSEAQARKVLGDICEAVGVGVVQAPSVRTFLEEWISSKKVTASTATWKRYDVTTRGFLNALGAKAELRLDAVTAGDIEKFRNAEKTAGKAARTANMALKTLRSAFATAKRRNLLLANPADAVDMLPAHSATRQPFTLDELRQLLAMADQEWRGMILVGGFAGLRIGDAAKLTWENVDFERRLLRFHPQKTRNRTMAALETPILPDVEEYLLALPVKSRRATDPLFPKLSKKKGTGANGLSNTFSRLIESAKIENAEAAAAGGKRGRRVMRLGFHSLRHTFISMMANAGVPKEVRERVVGNKGAVHDRYTHLEAKTTHEALAKLSTLSTPEQPQGPKP